MQHAVRLTCPTSISLRCAKGLELPDTQEESEILLQETAEAYAIEQTLGRPLELKAGTGTLLLLLLVLLVLLLLLLLLLLPLLVLILLLLLQSLPALG